MYSCAITGELPKESMARNPSVAVKNATARTVGNPVPVNREVHRILFSEIINIFFSSFPVFLPE